MTELLTLSTARFEDGINILSELGTALPDLISAFVKLKVEVPELNFEAKPEVIVGQVLANPKALAIVTPILQMGGLVGRTHMLRRMSAVMQAPEADLLEAEGNPAKQRELENAAALRSFMECAGDLVGFFSRLGISASVSPASSTLETKVEAEAAPVPSPGATPSGVS